MAATWAAPRLACHSHWEAWAAWANPSREAWAALETSALPKARDCLVSFTYMCTSVVCKFVVDKIMLMQTHISQEAYCTPSNHHIYTSRSVSLLIKSCSRKHTQEACFTLSNHHVYTSRSLITFMVDTASTLPSSLYVYTQYMYTHHAL